MKKLTGLLSIFMAGIVSASFAQEEDLTGIAALMKTHGVTESVAMLTPTICDLCGIPRPDVCETDTLSAVMNLAEEKLNGRKVQKVLVFCPDAIGKVQFEKWPDDFAPLLEASDYLMTGTNVLPSVTPVCFSTIFSGTSPEKHGIRKYEKPALKIQTLFDVFAAAEKKTAIVAENDCSIDRIFRLRPISYFSLRSSDESVQMTEFLLRNQNYDLIVCYDGDYDSTMHGAGVWSEKSHAAACDSIRRYLALAAVCDEVWKDYDRVTVFAPDHGSHNQEDGRGTHGSNSAEDSIVNHLWRIRAAGK